MPTLISPQTVPFPLVGRRVSRLWDPKDAAHHVIMAQSRAGKSHLITRGLLELRPYDRTLILDVKGDDDVWQGYGRPVEELRPAFGGDGDGPGGMRYRLVVDMADRPRAREQIRDALEQIGHEGRCIVVIDECRAITDRADQGGLGLAGPVESLLMRGGSRAVSVIIAAQDPSYVPATMRTQGAFRWAGHIPNRVVQERVSKMYGFSTADASVLLGIPKRSFLYSDSDGGLALTSLAA
jgi:hypothetical protein